MHVALDSDVTRGLRVGRPTAPKVLGQAFFFFDVKCVVVRKGGAHLLPSKRNLPFGVVCVCVWSEGRGGGGGVRLSNVTS